MKTTKFYKLNVGDTFYVISDYARIDQYEKTSDSYAEQILTTSSKWFDEEIEVYVD